MILFNPLASIAFNFLGEFQIIDWLIEHLYFVIADKAHDNSDT